MSLSLFFTAGYPKLNDTIPILQALMRAGVSRIEIGMPFSDPLADGPVIQESNRIALQNGMSIKKLFAQLSDLRPSPSDLRLYLMGYLNPVLQFGMENFLLEAKKNHIRGVIIPDLSPERHISHYRSLFDKHGLSCIFLITPRTSDARIRMIDDLSTDFIYVVSASSTTGNVGDQQSKEAYFKRIRAMNLKNELVIGFGISDKGSYEQAMKFASGAIVGSAFIRHLSKNGTENIPAFIKSIQS